LRLTFLIFGAGFHKAVIGKPHLNLAFHLHIPRIGFLKAKHIVGGGFHLDRMAALRGRRAQREEQRKQEGLNAQHVDSSRDNLNQTRRISG